MKRGLPADCLLLMGWNRGGDTRVTHSSRGTHLFWGPAGPNERPDQALGRGT